MEAVYIELSRLKPNRGQIVGLPKNPRFIRDAKYKKLVQSIKDDPEMLELRELIVYDSPDGYIIVGGNMRYRALSELGYTSAPCKIIPRDTAIEKVRRIVLKDNSSFGETDFDVLLNEWDLKDIEAAAIDIPDVEVPKQEEEEAEEDNFSEDEMSDEPPVCKEGDIWELGEHRLMCGDSTKPEDMAALMDGDIADLWLTDPPYNVDYESGNKKKILNDHMDSTLFREFLAKAFATASNFLKSGGAFYIWYATREHVNFELALQDNGLRVRQGLVWNKNAIVLGRQDYQWKHEPCMYGWKDGAAHYFCSRRDYATVIPDFDELDFDKMKKEQMRQLLEEVFSQSLTTVIDEKKPAKNEDHPTMKPVRLFAFQIRNSTKDGEIVLDTFGGSGTTIIAAEQIGRKARVMELDPHYCDVIIRRYEKFTGNSAKLIKNIKKNEETSNRGSTEQY